MGELHKWYNDIIGNTGLNHIFRGEIKLGTAYGVHHIAAICSSNARIIPSTIKDLGNGFYEASVEVLDGNVWLQKAINQHSFRIIGTRSK